MAAVGIVAAREGFKPLAVLFVDMGIAAAKDTPFFGALVETEHGAQVAALDIGRQSCQVLKRAVVVEDDARDRLVAAAAAHANQATDVLLVAGLALRRQGS